MNALQALLIGAIVGGGALYGVGPSENPKESALKVDQDRPTLEVVESKISDRGDFPTQVNSQRELRAAVSIFDEAAIEDRERLREVALSSSDVAVIRLALRSLGRLGLLSGDSEVLGLLGDSRSQVRHGVIDGLALDGGGQSLPLLMGEALGSADATTRQLSIRAIGRIGGESARDALETILESPDLSFEDTVFARSALSGSLAVRGRLSAPEASPSLRGSRAPVR